MSLPCLIVAVLLTAYPADSAVQTEGGAKPPASPQSAPVTLEGTSWTAVELYGTPVSTESITPGQEPYLDFGAKGRLAGSDGCNRVMGPYTVKGEAITFGEMAGTMMACPKTDEQAKRFRAALKGTGHWRIEKDRLHFYGATGKPLAVFERRPEKASGPAK